MCVRESSWHMSTVLFPWQQGEKCVLPWSNLLRFRYTYKDPCTESYEGGILKPKEKLFYYPLRWPRPEVRLSSLSSPAIFMYWACLLPPRWVLGAFLTYGTLFPQIQPSGNLSHCCHPVGSLKPGCRIGQILLSLLLKTDKLVGSFLN